MRLAILIQLQSIKCYSTWLHPTMTMCFLNPPLFQSKTVINGFAAGLHAKFYLSISHVHSLSINCTHRQTKQIGILLCKLGNIIRKQPTFFGFALLKNLSEVFTEFCKVRDDERVCECLLNYRYVVSNSLKELFF